MSSTHGFFTTADHPYFLIRKQGERFATRGKPSAEFGHRIESASHDVDDGVFAYWHWDGARLVAGNDRYGFFPLFWSRISGKGVCISPSITELIKQGAPTKLDVEALSVFFRLGYFVGEDTPFSEIRALPPNALFRWESGELECRARYPRIPELSAISHNEAIDGYIALFARAMAKRQPSKNSVAVPTSGGRDSRHMLLEMHKMGVAPTICVSERDPPPDPNEDVEIAAQLCDVLDFKHATVEHDLSVFSSQFRKTREVSFCEMPDSWFLPITDFLGQRFACVYDGIAGDVLSQSSFLSPEMDSLLRSRSKETSKTLLTKYGNGDSDLKKLLRGVLEPAAQSEVAITRLDREINQHLDAHNPVASFIFWNRTRRKIAMGPYGLLRNVPYVYAPYLDHDLYDFLTSLPASLQMDGTLHTKAIARAYPAYAKMPYADHKAAPPVDSRRAEAAYLAEAGKKFLLQRPSTLMNTVSPRTKMLLSMLSGGRVNPWVPPLIVYVDQIESILQAQMGGASYTSKSGASSYK